MAQYDGSIRINTKISVKEAEVQLTTLENRMKKTADKITSLRSKMDALKDAKVPTQEYKDISEQIAKANAEFDRLLEKQEQMQRNGKDHGASWDELNRKMDEVKNTIKYAKGELKDLVDTGKAFTLGSDTGEYAKLGQQLEYAESEMSVLSQRHDILESKQKKVGNGYKDLAGKAKTAFNSIGNVLKKTNATVDAFGRKIRETAQKHLPFFRKETEKAKNSTSSFAGRLKSLALSLLIFNQVSKAVRALSSSISAGFKNMYDDDVRFKASIDSLKASVLTLQNAFAAAFRPITDVAVPYIQEFVEWLTVAVDLAGQFFAALTGRKTYTRAIKQTAEASEEAAEAAKKETDEMKKQLSPLDKLNNLTSEKDKGKKDKETGIMFEEVPIDSKIQDMADKVKDILSKLFAPLKEAWNREGKFVMDSWKYALDEVWKLIKDIGRDFLTVWQQEKTIKVFEDMLHILGDIGLVIGHLARNFRDAWNENETGLHILENIRDIIGVIVHNFRLAADETVKWADQLDFGPLLESFEELTDSLIPVADALSGILKDFYTEVLLPLGKWTLEKGLPELLDVFTAFNKKVDWDALRDRLSEFWDHLEPFAETVGEGLIIFIERVSDAIANFINSETFVNFLHDVEDWMDSVTPEDVANGIERLVEAVIGLKVAFLGYKALSAVTGILTTIKTFLSFFKEGGAGAAVAGGMGKATTAVEGLASAFATLKTTLGAGIVFDLGIKNNAIDALEKITGDKETADKMRERYGSLGGTINILKDSFSVLRNSVMGYGAEVDGLAGKERALAKAMEDTSNGRIMSDENLAVLQSRFKATNEDIEMLRQNMLDVHPELRNVADTFGFLGDASAQSLRDISEGLKYVDSGVSSTDEIAHKLVSTFGQEMTPTAKNFFDAWFDSSGKLSDSFYELQAGEQVIEGYVDSLKTAKTSMQEFGEEVSDARQSIEDGFANVDSAKISDSITTALGAASESATSVANEAGKNIGNGIGEGMNQADIETPSQTFFGKLLDSIKSVFGIASPAKNMRPIGEFITLGMIEGFKSKFEAFTAPIQQLCNLITSKIANGLQSAKNVWSNTWMSMKDRASSILSSTREVVRSAVDWISQKIRSLASMCSGIRSTVGGLFSGNTSRGSVSSRMASPYAATPAIAALANAPIPSYATGQVIPRSMKQHLAIREDNNRETEVVSHLSTIEQAVINAMAKVNGSANNSGGNIYQFAVDGRVFFEIMQKYAEEYKKQSGGSPAFG